MQKQRILQWLFAFAIIATAALYGRAQQQTAELTGRITDASGAALSGAKVTVTNEARGIKVTVSSDAQGDYVVPLLPPADGYTVTVTSSGFTQATRAGITLQVAQVAQVNIPMAVGSVNQSIEVTGAPPMLDTQTSSEGQVIGATTITQLPLNGRSSFRLIQLTPGVTFSLAASGQFGDVPVNTQQDSDFNINGGRADSNEILIDGVPSTAGFFNAMTTIPSVDDTEEFKVESDNLSAEYGRFGGGVINVTTKSGTNDLHGTLFEFLRNKALDANDYFDASAGVAQPPFQMNQFGGAVGGPVVLPHIYRGRNKTFFFGDYQGTRRVQGSTFTGIVPTAQERAGDFSGDTGLTIYDPFSTKPDPNKPGHYIRNQFQGNLIPSNRLDPVAQALMTYYPLPNASAPGFNYINNAKLLVNQDEGSARIDQVVNDRYRFFGRFGWMLTNLTQPNSFGNVATPGAGAVGTTQFHNWSFAFDNTITISPTMFLTINYGFARWFQSKKTLSYGFDNSKLGFPSQFVDLVSIPVFPNINVPGYSGMSGQTYLINGNDSHSLLTSLTMIRGRHSLMMGADVRMHLINDFNIGSSAGTFKFSILQTEGPDPNQPVAKSGNAMASLLLGAGNAGSMSVGVGNKLRDWYAAAYLQDDIRLTSKLTLNAGLRYEEESPYTDSHNRLNYFDTTIPSPAANPSFPNLTGGLVFAGNQAHSSQVYTWNTVQFGPRLGFAYTPITNTVVRGGFGMVYAPLDISNTAVGFIPSTGFSSTTAWDTSQNGGLNPYDVLSNPYPQGLVAPSGSSQGPATALGQPLTVWDAHPKSPQSYQWNFGIQRQFPSSLMLEATYIGTRGLHLANDFNLDTLDPKYLSMGSALQAKVANPFQPYVSIGPLSAAKVTQQQLLLPYPQFTSVLEANATWGGSNYQSLQIKADKRTTHGVSLLAVYTISKWLSNVPASDSYFGTDNNNTTVQSYYQLQNEKSLSELDIPQALILNAVADLPFGRGHLLLHNANRLLDSFVGGWQLAGILTEEKGFPLALSAPIVDGGNRPNYVPGVSPRLSGSRPIGQKVKQYFNTAAFAIPPAFTFGNVRRTIGSVRSPALKNVDLSLIKQTHITERLHLDLRAEAFNLTNTPHFAFPDGNMSDKTFGQLTSLRPSPWAREIQLAAKLTF